MFFFAAWARRDTWEKKNLIAFIAVTNTNIQPQIPPLHFKSIQIANLFSEFLFLSVPLTAE